MTFLVQGAVTPDDSVSTVKIQDNAVTTAKIAASAISTAKIAANAVDETKLKDAFVADFTEVTVVAGDSILLGDLGDGGNTKRDTVQGILDLASSGLEFVSTASISAATTLAITSLAAGYDYIITLEAFAPTDDNEILWMRFSDDAGSSYESGASDYAWGATNNGTNQVDAADSEIQLSAIAAFGNDSGNFSTFEITLYNPNSTGENTTTQWSGFNMSEAATPFIENVFGGAYFLQGTDEVDAVQFLWSGGSTFKAQGDISVWRRIRS